MDTELPRIALIGCGQWGRNLARNLASLSVLRTICDPNPVVLEGARALYPGVETTQDADTALTDPEIDACVIATPAISHAPLGRRALEHGKDVLIEKPLAVTVAEGQALVDLARASGRILMVGHLLEYHPALETLRELVARGELGKLHYVYTNRLNLGRIRTEENALWSFAPHDVHVLLRLLGEEPTDVSCQGGSYLNSQVADVTMSTMRFASGVRAHIFVSWLHPFKDHKIVVVGDRKMAVFEDTLGADKLRLYPHRVEWRDRVPVAVKADAETVPLSDEEPLARECRHFVECVTSRSVPRTDGANGVAVLRVLDMCQRSLERDGVPIHGQSESGVPRYYKHSSAVVDPGCEIGEGARIWHYSHVMPGARIGEGSTIGQNVFIAKGVTIGRNVKIQNNVSLYEGVALEDDVFCGPSMVFTNVVNPRSHVSRKSEYQQTLVRRGATIGANATIVCGHTIGEYAFVGAGAVVTKDVPAYALALGSPARVVGWMCQCGVRLPDPTGSVPADQICAACGTAYQWADGAPKRAPMASLSAEAGC
ncbi:MAG TPA: Gfo/Idh/MocA family oxidoreductase [Vicinamibacterales bacterium]|nr:Gfo/Idh/MocA family oxidoreductase [Vicinamibacterales bacterium]